MAIRQLGKINFGSLGLYVWKSATDFLQTQTFIRNFLLEFSNLTRSPGILYGGQVTAGAGLTLNIAKGAALMASGDVVTWDAQAVVLAAADPANPRIDRVELNYSLVNGTVVVNTLNANEVRDLNDTGTAVGNTGVAAGVPAAPALTAGNLSLALVTVPANSLVPGTISQQEDTAYSLSYYQLGNSTYGIRYAPTANQFQVCIDGGTWVPLSLDSIGWTKLALANNTGPANVTGLLFDSTKVVSGVVTYDVYRNDGVTDYHEVGSFVVGFDAIANAWWGGGQDGVNNGNDPGVALTITAGGQVQYKSTNIAGSAGFFIRFRAKTTSL
jgi:hypothetical protein